MSTDLIERHLGGESGARSMLGRAGKKSRRRGFVVTAILFVTLAAFVDPWIGLVVGVVGAVLTSALTLEFGPGADKWGQLQITRRTREMSKANLGLFRPVRDRPEELDRAVTEGSKKERRAALEEWNSYRDQHNAADGLTWLRAAPGETGIAWHAPLGEEPYLSVVYPVQGQIRGLESDRRLSGWAQSFGGSLTAHGDMKAHAKRIQMITRMLPVDTAVHQAWVLKNVRRGREWNPDVDPLLTESYAQVVNGLRRSSGGLGQRHFAVIRWPLTNRLLAAGERRGDGVEGLRRAMDSEIASGWRRLEEAGLVPGQPLTAAQVAAMMRHQQCPDWPIDYAGDLDPCAPDPWLAEDGTARDHSVVTCEVPPQVLGVDPGTGPQTSQWWHATARVPIEEVETGPRTPLWLLPMLTGMNHPVVRTVSVEFETVPASQARKQARNDLTVDMADIHSQEHKGQLVGDDLEAAKTAATSRVKDLAPGSGHHGGYWCMHVTVSAPSRDDLIEAMDRIEEAAENCAINALEWLHGYGVAHHGVTWPLARAMQAPKKSATENMRTLMAGKGRKDALR